MYSANAMSSTSIKLLKLQPQVFATKAQTQTLSASTRPIQQPKPYSDEKKPPSATIVHHNPRITSPIPATGNTSNHIMEGEMIHIYGSLMPEQASETKYYRYETFESFISFLIKHIQNEVVTHELQKNKMKCWRDELSFYEMLNEHILYYEEFWDPLAKAFINRRFNIVRFGLGVERLFDDEVRTYNAYDEYYIICPLIILTIQYENYLLTFGLSVFPEVVRKRFKIHQYASYISEVESSHDLTFYRTEYKLNRIFGFLKEFGNLTSIFEQTNKIYASHQLDEVNHEFRKYEKSFSSSSN